MRIDKIKAFIGFAIRSGNVIFGSDKLFEDKKIPILVLICSTQNDKVSNKVINYCKDRNIKYIKLEELILSDLVSRENCKVIGIVDKSLAKALKNEFEMENN